MAPSVIPFTAAELTFIALYISSLIAIGYFGMRARKEHTLRDFYLAGPGVGFVVLLLTLYATQYSGNTLFGYTGRSYAVGYSWVMSVHFMTGIIVFYLIFAPKLHALSRRHNFVTPTDFLHHRFGSTALSVVATLLMIAAVTNYLLAQLMAMGRAMQGLTTIDDATAYIGGVILLAVIIVIYETLGGFRAVAWTDVIQGSVLLIGFGILLLMVFREYGSLEDATLTILQEERDLQVTPEQSKILPPGWETVREWISYILILGIGASLYPQAIQRIYAARSPATLRRSLSVMAFLPLTTTLVALIIGVYGAAYIELADGVSKDTILTALCRRVQETPAGRWLVVILFSAILAGLMSTADSVLLSVSSMVSKDLYGRLVDRKADEKRLTFVGKAVSWLVIVLGVGLAIGLRKHTDLVTLLDRKFDLLIQLSPAFFVGVHWRKMRGDCVLLGMIAGVAIALIVAATVDGKPYGIHAGIYGLAVNFLIAVGGSAIFGQDDSSATVTSSESVSRETARN